MKQNCGLRLIAQNLLSCFCMTQSFSGAFSAGEAVTLSDHSLICEVCAVLKDGLVTLVVISCPALLTYTMRCIGKHDSSIAVDFPV